MYDDIAPLYHLVYEDWEAAIAAQGAAFDQLIRALVGPAPQRVLDVSCGIGTQALGLAARGHDVVASDLSPGAVERAAREALTRGLEIPFSVADMRRADEAHAGLFDVVLTADNSMPHLDGDVVLGEAISAFHARLRPGGALIVGLRDYTEDEDRSSPQFWRYGFRWHEGMRYCVFQTRDWEGDAYDVAMYFVREATDDRPAAVTAGRSRYHAVTIHRLTTMIEAAGFAEVARHDGVVHQPVVTALQA